MTFGEGQHTIYYKFQIGGSAVAVSWFSLQDRLAYTYLADDYCPVGRCQHWIESSRHDRFPNEVHVSA